MSAEFNKKSEIRKRELENIDADDNDMKYFAAVGKLRKAERYDRFKDEIVHTLSDHYYITEVNNYGFDIHVKDETLLYYPSTQKIFRKKQNKWQVVTLEKLGDFLEKI